MAGHEDLANCRIRSIPKSQGGGLGVYAEDEIWHGQELLLANRDYPTEEEATARETYLRYGKTVRKTKRS